MTISRTLIGGVVGVLIGLLWYTLGTGAVLAAIGVGLIGVAIGWILQNPGRIAELFQRLERD